jgi:sterol desaturase/sphingolipid hydroxylase (fatty acid hydroxylase superfamily)
VTTSAARAVKAGWAGAIVGAVLLLAAAAPFASPDRLFVNLIELPAARLRDTVCSWPLWLALGVTLALQRVAPADARQRHVGYSVREDLVWFVYQPFLNAAIVGTYVALIVKLHGYYTPWLAADLTALASWVRVVLALVIGDLCLWVQHYLNHKVPIFWRFHAVHHSQRELNFFTDSRYHAIEYVVRHTLLVIPLVFMKIEAPVIMAVVIFRDWYSAFYHGNIRANLGPLRYLLVTPQSHRIHHSIEPRHRDKNFGALFSVWDRLFGQHYAAAGEYPRTGIDDPGFPHAGPASFRALLLGPWVQMAYPLRKR